MKEPATDAARRETMLRFRDGFYTLQLATASAEGEPEASDLPMIRDGGCFHVLISGLARHTANLEANPRAGVLLIEPLAERGNAFARRRLSYFCRAETLAPDTEDHARLLEAFAARFGAIIATLRALPDFRLVRLRPLRGTYVLGFGQAWRLTGPELDRFEHIGPGRKAGED